MLYMFHKLKPVNTLIFTTPDKPLYTNLRDHSQPRADQQSAGGHAEYARPIKPPSCNMSTEHPPVVCQLLNRTPDLYAPFSPVLLLDDHWNVIC